MYKDQVKAIRVADLIAILQELPATHYVWPNEVGNLLVTDQHPGEDESEDVGWIDLNHEEWNPFDR